MLIKKKRFPFYIGIMTLVTVVIILLAALFLLISHRESKATALRMADQLFSEINQKTMERYENALQSAAVLVGVGSRMPGIAEPPTGDGRSHAGWEFMLEALDFFDFLLSLYMGYDDGSFIQIVAIRGNADLRSVYDAPRDTAYVLRTILPGPQDTFRLQYIFLGENRQPIGLSSEQNATYDPRLRPWYKRAQAEEAAFFTEPYVFSASKLPGITCAERMSTGTGVFGVDITLDRFTESLQRQKISDNSTLFLFDRRGRIIAHPGEDPIASDAGNALEFRRGNESSDPLVRAVFTGYGSRGDDMLNRTLEIKIAGVDYLVRLSTMKPDLEFDQLLAAVAPVSDFTGHIRRMQRRTFFFSGLVMLIALPLVLLMSKKISVSLKRLEHESRKIQGFDFSDSPPFDSRIKEIHAHIKAFVLMKTTIRDRTDALIATQKKLETLVQSGIALTAEDDMDRLLQKLFDSARDLSRAEGGALYLRDASDNLCFEIMRHGDSITVKSEDAGTQGVFAPIPIFAGEKGKHRRGAVEREVVLTGKTVVINRIDDAAAVETVNACQIGESGDIDCHNVLTTPLKTREGNTIGVMQVFNARDEKSGGPTDFQDAIIEFVEALAAQAAVALHNKRLLAEQRELFDAFIQLIAGAIDAKSPYTGGHCARVPIVATMLARAAHEVKNGPFAGFRMDTEDQWRAFDVAAWLHDCGKVTTPEYIVDKATKLETIYNRIHEIRMRFEVLWRDAEIDYLRKQLAGDTDDNMSKEDLIATHNHIKEDFTFVAHCNIGGEFMEEDKIERLKQIASQTWERHLDDRIGISEDEARLKSGRPAPDLPVTEYILADKPEHIVPRTDTDLFDGNPYGFNMVVPEDLYNHGELYNLCIPRGTLSLEDRFKINEHIIETIKMLEKLPFPEYLKNVTEFAGGHHETMIGTGYPKGLKKEEMSIPARIMAIADIFEALTAADRPYKHPKKLSEALAIMSAMRNDQHIDADLFDLFLRSGIYRTYAEHHLSPAYVDSVDIRDYLSHNVAENPQIG